MLAHGYMQEFYFHPCAIWIFVNVFVSRALFNVLVPDFVSYIARANATDPRRVRRQEITQ